MALVEGGRERGFVRENPRVLVLAKYPKSIKFRYKHERHEVLITPSGPSWIYFERCVGGGGE